MRLHRHSARLQKIRPYVGEARRQPSFSCGDIAAYNQGTMAMTQPSAVLTRSLLGGAMATQIRIGNPLFSHILFSMYLALFMWGGLWLRDMRVRAVLPILR
jgi:hypothetical protein